MLKRYCGPWSFYRRLIRLVSPIATQQVLMSAIFLFHALLAGIWARSGSMDQATATAAIHVGGRYFISANWLLSAISIACSIILAQLLGAKKQQGMKETFHLNLLLVGLGAVLFIVFAFLFKRNIVTFFASARQGKETLSDEGSRYLLFLIPSLLPLAVSSALAYSLRSLKHTVIPLISALIATVMEVTLSCLLLFTSSLGLVSLAVGFFGARILEMIILLIWTAHIHPDFWGRLPRKEAQFKTSCTRIFRTGFPIVLSQVLTEGVLLFMFWAFGHLPGGVEQLTAIAILQQIVDLCYALLGGMGTVASILIGVYVGAHDGQKAKQHGDWIIGYVLIVSMLLSLLMLTFIPLIKAIYGVIPYFAPLLIWQAITIPAFFLVQNIIFIMRAGGYSSIGIYLTNLPNLLIKVPIVLYLVVINPDWYATQNVIQTILSFFQLPPSFFVFLFCLDRLLEVMRTPLAWILYHKVQWYERHLVT